MEPQLYDTWVSTIVDGHKVQMQFHLQKIRLAGVGATQTELPPFSLLE